MPPRRRLLALALAAPCALAAGPARADPPPGERDHAGLMLRAAIGVGYQAVRGDDSPLQLSGVGFAAHLAAGWYVVPNLAVHATLWSGAAFNPSGTSPFGSVTAARDNTPWSVGRGLGLTWVCAPVHAFVSVSVGVSGLDLQTTTADIVVVARAAPGVALNVMVGKQFEMTSGWRFGVGAQGFFHRSEVTTRGAVEDVSSGGGALVGTLTYH